MDLNQLDFPRMGFDEKKVCDGCTKEFDDGDYVIEYFSDTIWQQYDRVDLPRPVPQEIYCLYCYPDEIPIPHIGTNEGFSFLTIKYDSEEDIYRYDETGVIKGSPKSDGIKWSPIDVLDELHVTPIEETPYIITPMHVFITFRKIGVDLRGFVLNGELNIPEDTKDQIKKLSGIYVGGMHRSVHDPAML